MVLESRFRIQTDTGSLDQIDIGWGSEMDEGWRLDPASVSGDVIIPSNGDQLSQTGRLQVGWTTPKSGLVDLNLRFFRPMSSGVLSSNISLPQIKGSRSLSADLLHAMWLGKESTHKAFFTGRIRTSGNLLKAMQLGDVFQEAERIYPTVARKYGLDGA